MWPHGFLDNWFHLVPMALSYWIMITVQQQQWEQTSLLGLEQILTQDCWVFQVSDALYCIYFLDFYNWIPAANGIAGRNWAPWEIHDQITLELLWNYLYGIYVELLIYLILTWLVSKLKKNVSLKQCQSALRCVETWQYPTELALEAILILKLTTDFCLSKKSAIQKLATIQYCF